MWVRLGSTDLMAGKVMFLRSNQGDRLDGNESVADSFEVIWSALKAAPRAANQSQISLYHHPIREQPLSSQPCQKTLNISHPDHLPRLPDSIDQPITAMPQSKMKNPTPSPSPTSNLSRQGIEDCVTVQTPKNQSSNSRGFSSLLRLPEKTSSREVYSLPEVTPQSLLLFSTDKYHPCNI
ncbi:hypothetical protein TNCV_667341 [Trichonephila clavipes]|nr:hypothetical protein TNCV_667341 [Trichonephila clavipes]